MNGSNPPRTESQQSSRSEKEVIGSVFFFLRPSLVFLLQIYEARSRAYHIDFEKTESGSLLHEKKDVRKF